MLGDRPACVGLTQVARGHHAKDGMDGLELHLQPTKDAPARARAALRDLELPRRALDDLKLVVSELVTNAVRYGPGDRPVQLRLAIDGDVVRGEVVDQGDGEEAKIEIRESSPDEPGGRGLKLVDRLAERWGVHEGSTHVWFELRAR